MLNFWDLYRKQKLEEAEQRRLAAEEQMEARRRELIEEGGYWKNRMAQDEKTQALQEESIIKAGSQVSFLTYQLPSNSALSVTNPSSRMQQLCPPQLSLQAF